MRKPKPLMAPYYIRRASIATLRAKLGELQGMSDAGDGREEVYSTFVAITNEIERRKAKANAKPATLISRGTVYVMPVVVLREKITNLLQQEQTEIVRDTIALLSGEIGRRSVHAKQTYWRRKAAAKAFVDHMKAVILEDRAI